MSPGRNSHGDVVLLVPVSGQTDSAGLIIVDPAQRVAEVVMPAAVIVHCDPASQLIAHMLISSTSDSPPSMDLDFNPDLRADGRADPKVFLPVPNKRFPPFMRGGLHWVFLVIGIYAEHLRLRQVDDMRARGRVRSLGIDDIAEGREHANERDFIRCRRQNEMSCLGLETIERVLVERRLPSGRRVQRVGHVRRIQWEINIDEFFKRGRGGDCVGKTWHDWKTPVSKSTELHLEV